VGKLYCKVLLNRVASWAEKHLPREQAGFRPNRACECDTIILNEVLARARADKKEVYVAFVDLRKAYDTVWRKGLWYKLHRLGLPHKLICLFQELYSQCPNEVLVQGIATDHFDILLGLKQGCVLSPTLFNLYISDLPTHIQQSCLPWLPSLFSPSPTTSPSSPRPWKSSKLPCQPFTPTATPGGFE